jgi:hypothetical protein
MFPILGLRLFDSALRIRDRVLARLNGYDVIEAVIVAPFAP